MRTLSRQGHDFWLCKLFGLDIVVLKVRNKLNKFILKGIVLYNIFIPTHKA